MRLSCEAPKLNDLGEVLVKENLSSIHHRYPDTLENPDDTPGPIEQYWLTPYEYTQTRQLTVVEAIKAIHCLNYQSCEHPEWEQSAAFEFLRRFESSLVTSLPEYDDAIGWSIEEDQVKANIYGSRKSR